MEEKVIDTEDTDDVTVSVGKSADNDDVDVEKYPSAEFLVDACYQDYQRLQDNYNQIYEKANIALAFVGVVLTVTLTTLDFSSLSKLTANLMVWQLVMILLEFISCIGGLLLLMSSAIRFLRLLKGRDVPVFNSVAIRDDGIYYEKKENAALWLIDKYTVVVVKIRDVIQEKQKAYDSSLTMTIVGIILYAVSIVLKKGGF
jgi:hypothetical protein